jgi:hypothetical protein
MRASFTIKVLQREIVPAVDVLTGKWVDRHGSFLYIIADKDAGVALYVGRTFPSLNKRFNQHIAKKSKIGRLLDTRGSYCLHLIVTILQIDGMPSFAEMDLIERWSPILNKQRKKCPFDIVWIGPDL